MSALVLLALLLAACGFAGATNCTIELDETHAYIVRAYLNEAMATVAPSPGCSAMRTVLYSACAGEVSCLVPGSTCSSSCMMAARTVPATCWSAMVCGMETDPILVDYADWTAALANLCLVDTPVTCGGAPSHPLPSPTYPPMYMGPAYPPSYPPPAMPPYPPPPPTPPPPRPTPVAPTSITRYGAATSSILSGITVPASHALYWSSGTVPAAKNASAPAGSRERFGNTTEQAISCLTRLQALLAENGLTFSDTIYLRAFLVADPFLNGTVDYQGWFAAYAQFFNREGSTRTARSTMAVTSLVNSEWLIEIELWAAYPTPGAVTPTPGVTSAFTGPSSLSRYGAATSSILSGVTVPTGHAYYHSSGTVPAVKDPAAPRGSRERYGNTTEQAVSVLTRIGALLAEQGLSFEDSVYVRCYLVADPFLNGTIDTAGWNAAYGMFFNKPGSTRVARSTLAVAGLVDSDWLVEIELVAVYPTRLPTPYIAPGTPGVPGEVLRHGSNGTGVILSGVTIPADTAIYWSSGTVPSAQNSSLPVGTRERFGNTTQQALTILSRFVALLNETQLSLADAIFMRVYLTPDPFLNGTVDYNGWFAAYNSVMALSGITPKVARSTMGVPALVNPEWLIEIEVVAVFSKPIPPPVSPPPPALPAPPPPRPTPVAPTSITRYGAATSSILSGITVPASHALYWSSGTVPAAKNASAPAGSRERFGNTTEQAISCLTRLQALLAENGLTFSDTIYLRAFLVADLFLNGTVDYQGWFNAYAQFFNREGSTRTARSTMAVTSLVNPEWLIEIELWAAYPTPGAVTPAPGVPTGGPSSLSRYGAATSSILSGVTVPTGHAFYHSSGTVPAVKDPAAPRGSRERYGNTTEQAVSVLTRIGALLAEQGLGFEDSVYVRCYLVADPFLNGTIDTAGWNAAYGMFFNKPGSTRVARSTLAVAGLVDSDWLVEIELVAVYPTRLPTPYVAPGTPGVPGELLRHGSNGTGVILSGVTIPADTAIYWSSGTVPSAQNSSLPVGSRERFGNTTAQALTILTRFVALLNETQLSLADAIFMRVYLTPDPFLNGTVDYNGWFSAYNSVMALPGITPKVARSTMGVPALVNPEWLVEIEVVAVLPKDVPPPAMRRTRQLLGRRSAGPLRISVA